MIRRRVEMRKASRKVPGCLFSFGGRVSLTRKPGCIGDGWIVDVFCQRRAVRGMPGAFLNPDRNGDEPIFAMRGVLFCHFYFFYVHLDNKKYT